jgi:hypothetical protein
VTWLPNGFAGYAATLRQGIENMRKLVYAFYDPNFSFRTLTDKYPDLAGDITDCLSGDVNKDFLGSGRRSASSVRCRTNCPMARR